jgi:hypothetical protein
LRTIARLCEATRTDRALLLRALGMLAYVRVGLTCLPLPRLRERLARPNRAPAVAAGAVPIADAVRRAARWVPGARCLEQALAAHTLLRRHGHPAELRIGAARSPDGRLEAHAWVELHGRVLLGKVAGMSRFRPLRSSRTPSGEASDA